MSSHSQEMYERFASDQADKRDAGRYENMMDYYGMLTPTVKRYRSDDIEEGIAKVSISVAEVASVTKTKH